MTVATTTADAFNSGQLAIPTADRDIPATYIVEATNSVGTTASPPITVIVAPATAPRFKSQTGGLQYRTGDWLGVTVDDPGPYTYVWMRDGVVIPGHSYASNFSTETLDPSSHGEGIYTVQVSNAVGTVISRSMPVKSATSGATAYIYQQPGSLGLRYGQSDALTFRADTSGLPSPTYQWRKDGVDIPGATLAWLAFPKYEPSQAGLYAVKITAGDTTIVSDNAEVATIGRTVAQPVILTGPTDRSLQQGDSITLGVAADAGGTATYRWFKDGSTLAGATTDALFLPNVTSTDAGRYAVEVANEYGATRSDDAVITVTAGTPAPLAPMILGAAPQSTTLDAGTDFTLAVRVTGTPTPTLQWTKDGVAIAGATRATLVLSNVQDADAGTYWLGASNASGSVQAPLATVWIRHPNTKPWFTDQPPAKWSVAGNGSASLTYTATGTPSPGFQLLKDGKPLVITASDIHYATTRSGNSLTLQITAADATVAGTYSAIASNVTGATTSDTTIVAVRPSEISGIYFSPVDSTRTDIAAAVYVRPDRTTVLMTTGGHRTLPLAVAAFTPNSDGTFTAQYTPPNTTTPTTISGSFRTDAVRLSSGYESMLFNRKSASGAFASVAGYWTAPLGGGSTGTAHAVVDAQGEVIVTLLRTNGQVETLRGQLDATSTMHQSGAYSTFSRFDVHFDADGTCTGDVRSYSAPAATFSGTREGDVMFNTLANISTRGRTGGGAGLLTAGFVITGSAPRTVLIRAAGPSLGKFGVSDPLSDTHLDIIRAGTLLAANDDWGSDPAVQTAADRLGAFPFAPGSKDAAILMTLEPGLYSARVSGGSSIAPSTSGVSLVEVYDAGESTGPAQPRLANISTLGWVGTGENALAAGIVIHGSSPKRVLVRGVGPGLAPFKVDGALADPLLRIYQGDTVLAENNDWSYDADTLSAMKSAGAFDLTGGSRDAVLLLTLAPGLYTAQVSGFSGTTGIALVEVYELTQ